MRIGYDVLSNQFPDGACGRRCSADGGLNGTDITQKPDRYESAVYFLKPGNLDVGSFDGCGVGY